MGLQLQGRGRRLAVAVARVGGRSQRAAEQGPGSRRSRHVALLAAVCVRGLRRPDGVAGKGKEQGDALLIYVGLGAVGWAKLG